MKSGFSRKAFVVALGMALATGAGLGASPAFAASAEVASGTSWTVPTGQMTGGNTVTVDGKLYKVVTTWANAWALSGPDYVGVSNSGSLNQMGGGGSTAELKNAQNSTLLGIWASSANEVPNAYNWNYFWNLYCADQNYSSDRYADFSVVEVSNGAAASFEEGVYSPFKYRPEVIWTSNSLKKDAVATYTKLIREGKYYASGEDAVAENPDLANSGGQGGPGGGQGGQGGQGGGQGGQGGQGGGQAAQSLSTMSTKTALGLSAQGASSYYIAGDENYDPYIIDPNNSTPMAFVNSLYELAGVVEKVKASTAGYNADGAITSKNVTWKTMNALPRTTRYEASSENALSARECALEDEKLVRASVYYTLAKIADGTTKMKKVAFLTESPDFTGDTASIAVFDTVDTVNMGADGGLASFAPLVVNQLGADFDTSQATTKNDSNGYMVYTATVDQLASCDVIIATVSGDGRNAAFTSEQLKTWLADKASSAKLKEAAGKIECATTAPSLMNRHGFTIEKQLFGIYNLCFVYPELFPNMELLTYWYDNIYHLKSDSVKTAMQWGLGNVTLPTGASLADMGKSYSAKNCNIKFQEGVKYYNSKKGTDAVLKMLQGTTGRYTGAANADYSSCRPSEDLLSWASSYKAPAAAQTVKISTSKLTVKAGKSATIKASAKTKKTFKKVSGSKNITISTAGKLTVKKGLKKGTYKVKVKVSAAATSSYKSASATKTISVVVK